MSRNTSDLCFNGDENVHIIKLLGRPRPMTVILIAVTSNFGTMMFIVGLKTKGCIAKFITKTILFTHLDKMLSSIVH